MSSAASFASAPHHDGSPVYLAPLPSTPGGTVSLRVHVPDLEDGSPGAGRVRVRWGQDGEPRFRDLTVAGGDGVGGDGDGDGDGDAAGAGSAGGQWWVGELPMVNRRTSYRFLLEGPDGVRHRWLTAEGVSHREVSDRADFVVDASPAAPEWVTDQVAYQVFPDRFARSAAAATRPVPSWGVARSWGDAVDGTGRGAGRQYFGGDIDGIVAHLDHLVDLGVGVLYLTPVFEGHSNHRYDAVSFDRVDPVLGGDEAYQRLIDAAHERGLRVLGDLTTNHTGRHHEWFRAAQADPTSPEAGFYVFHEHPEDYHSWLGHRSLPTLDYTSQELRRRMYEGADSVVGRWVAAGLDGWRIDVANMTGRQGAVDLTREVARGVREAMARVDPDTWLLAEHFFDASADLTGDGWHGVMDYTGASMPLWWWLAAPGATPHATVPLPIAPLPASDVVETIREVHARYPWNAVTASTVHLDSHDTARFRTIAGGGEHGGIDDGAASGGLARTRHLMGAALQLTLPGVPALFAGDELGLTGANGEHSRTPMPWDAPETWDAPTYEAYRRLIALRREHTALRRGSLRWLSAGEDHLTFVREHADGRVLVHAVRPHPDGSAPRDGEVALPAAVLGAGDPVTLLGEPLGGEPLGDEPLGGGPLGGEPTGAGGSAVGRVWLLPGTVGVHAWAFDGDGLAWPH